MVVAQESKSKLVRECRRQSRGAWPEFGSGV